jgi:glucose/mannose-6-phosphate isomerase
VINLDDLEAFQKIDRQNMLARINGLPRQLMDAWELGRSQPLPAMEGIQSVIITGMGGFAIGADIAVAYAAPRSSVPVLIHRGYDLPAWAQGPGVLVIALSHAGEAEETLEAFAQARSHGCRLLVISTGGKLAQMGEAAGVPVWRFAREGQPRAAVGYSSGFLLAALARLGLLPDPGEDVREAVTSMRDQQPTLMPEMPVAKNPAKRMAGQLMGRLVVMIAADYMEPAARRWKDQINENAKAWAQCEFLPEADHNSLEGLVSPENALSNLIVLFIDAPRNQPRNLLRLDLTRQVFMTQGINTDVYHASGKGELAHLFTALQFGDYTSYYLAMAYGVDPSPVDVLTMFHQALRDTRPSKNEETSI